MAHNISIQNGIEETFQAGKPAWHHLGVNVKQTQTWREAMKLAHMDWKITKEQFSHPLIAGELIPSFGLFRADNQKYLSTVGPAYTPIQNDEAFAWVDTIIGIEDGAFYETAGALGNGETIWCMVKIPQEIRIKGTDDIIDPYLLFSDFREQGKAAIVKLSTVRVVCNNTLNMSLSDGQKVMRITHVNPQSQMELAKKALQSVKANIKNLNDTFNELTKRKMTRPTMTALLNKLFPTLEESTAAQNKARAILEKYEFCDDNAFPSEKGSAFAMLNAITNYVDHEKTARTTDGDNPIRTRAQSSMFGTGDIFKTQAMTAIMEITKDNPRSAADAEVFDMGQVSKEIEDMTW